MLVWAKGKEEEMKVLAPPQGYSELISFSQSDARLGKGFSESEGEPSRTHSRLVCHCQFVSGLQALCNGLWEGENRRKLARRS